MCADVQVELTAIVALAIAVMAPTLHSSKGKPPLPTALYLLLTTSALVYARMVLYDELQLLLGYPPSAGVLTGALIIALALAQLPLVQQRFAHSQSAKRMVACLAAVGLLLAVLKPPLPDKVSEFQMLNWCCCTMHSMSRFMHSLLTCSHECVGSGLLLAVLKPPLPDKVSEVLFLLYVFFFKNMKMVYIPVLCHVQHGPLHALCFDMQW